MLLASWFVSLSACESPNCLSISLTLTYNHQRGRLALLRPSVGCLLLILRSSKTALASRTTSVENYMSCNQGYSHEAENKHQVSYKYDEDKSRLDKSLVPRHQFGGVYCLCNSNEPKIRLQSSQYKNMQLCQPRSTEFDRVRHVRPWFSLTILSFYGSLASARPAVAATRRGGTELQTVQGSSSTGAESSTKGLRKRHIEYQFLSRCIRHYQVSCCGMLCEGHQPRTSMPCQIIGKGCKRHVIWSTNSVHKSWDIQLFCACGQLLRVVEEITSTVSSLRVSLPSRRWRHETKHNVL